jgi:hypothetical protein
MRDLPQKPLNQDDQDQEQEEVLRIEFCRSSSKYWYEMNDPLIFTNLRKDEYDIDFEYAAPTK